MIAMTGDASVANGGEAVEFVLTVSRCTVGDDEIRGVRRDGLGGVLGDALPANPEPRPHRLRGRQALKIQVGVSRPCGR